MALGTSADITPVLTTAYGMELFRQWNRLGNTASSAIDIRPGEFKQVFWPVSTGGASVSVVTEGSDIQSGEYDQDNTVPLTLVRGYYRAPFTITDSERAMANKSPLSPQPLLDLVQERFFEKATALWSRINHDVLQGTGSDPSTSNQCIQGLESSLLTSGSYASASLSTYPALASNLSGSDGGTGTQLTLAQMDQDLAAIYIACGERPDKIVMHPYVVAQYKGLATAVQTIMQVNGAMIGEQNLGGSAMQFNNTVASFNGIPIVEDKDAYVFGTPGDGYGHILYLKKRTIVLDFLPYEPQADELLSFNMEALDSNGEVTSKMPFMFNVFKLGRTGSATKYALQVETQLKVTRPNANGIRRGVKI